MTSLSIGKLKKNKKRRILVISASGTQGGIQCIYIGAHGTWEILSHAMMPYPQKLATIVEKLASGNLDSLRSSDYAWFDLKLSQLMVECARTVLAQVPRSIKQPHLAVLNKPSFWKGPIGENLQQMHWDVTAGDAQYVSSSLEIPVFTDFVRHNLLAGGNGSIPTLPGNVSISAKCTGIAAFVNIGLISRMTIIDSATGLLLLDSDAGPGTCLIDKIAKDISQGATFDRDGSIAAQGKVDGECLNTLVTSEWFLKGSPKNALPDQFDELLEEPSLNSMPINDRLATITALTARSIYNLYRQEFKGSPHPQKIYISGGGTHNLTLMEYMAAYFQPITIHNIEELGIPADMRIPLALGLTVDAHLSGVNIPWETGSNPKVIEIGKWVFP